MDQTQLYGLIIAAAIGIAAVILISLRQRRDADDSGESPFAASTEGEKRCPKCGMGNLWTEDRCAACGAKLPG
jgi:hypothetical protein